VEVEIGLDLVGSQKDPVLSQLPFLEATESPSIIGGHDADWSLDSKEALENGEVIVHLTLERL